MKQSIALRWEIRQIRSCERIGRYLGARLSHLIEELEHFLCVADEIRGTQSLGGVEGQAREDGVY